MTQEQEIKDLEARLAALKTPQPASAPYRIDLGCGPNKREGFVGIDKLDFPAVDVKLDIGSQAWPWADSSVDEAHCSHTIEHLSWPERVHFFNELGRVLKKGAKATLVWPHWCADRYWGDPTHQQPLSPFALLYLNAEWRKGNAPHVPYTCDFDHTIAYSLAPWMNGRNQEFTQFAMIAYKEACQDVQATLIKR